MRYPKKIKKGDNWGITATSTGVTGIFEKKMDVVNRKLTDRGFNVVESESLRKNRKLVSESRERRAEEFNELYSDEEVTVITPPWGGEFLMEILPSLDEEIILKKNPKWIMGYSDTSTLLFYITTRFKIATIHGINILELSGTPEHESVLRSIELMESDSCMMEFKNYELYQKEWGDPAEESRGYILTEKVEWKSVFREEESFQGRLIGGCLDTIKTLIGTPFDYVGDFIQTYKEDGFIWYFESCNMDITDVYRTLWQMKQAGWFQQCKGVLYGRSDGLEDVNDFTFEDVFRNVFMDGKIPVILDVDIGHLPPQIPIINGAVGTVEYKNGKGKIIQERK